MKRFANVVLMLCIAMMCTTPFEAQGQNRRTGGNTSTTTQKKEQSSSTKSSGPALQSRPTQTTSTPQRNSANTRSSSTTTQRNNAPAQRNTAPAQVQDRRNTTTTKPAGTSHSAQISRKNSDVGRQNIPAAPRDNGNRNNNSRNNNSSRNNDNRYGDPVYRPGGPGGNKPAAVQYHNEPPRPREPHYARPYLEPKHPPMPSYRYGDHFFGYRLNMLPRGYTTIRVGGLDYYYYDGIYYRPYGLGGYYVCRPPRGTSVAQTMLNVALTAVAINTIRDEIARARRAAALSTVYSTGNTGYVVRTSDDYYNTNLLNQANQEYYYQDGVFYILSNGQYYVIEAPIGALVTEIPADYDEIELDGKTYYKVEDTLYKTTVIDGALYFEVVCNL